MVAQRKETESIRTFVIRWVTEGLSTQMSLQEASADCLNEIKKTKRTAEFLEEFGATAIADCWRAQNSSSKAQISKGTRRVDVAKLQDGGGMLETIWNVDGVWMRLGDLDFKTCEVARQEYQERAEQNSRKAVFLARISAKLEGGQLVRDVFDEAALREIQDEISE